MIYTYIDIIDNTIGVYSTIFGQIGHYIYYINSIYTDSINWK